MDSQPAMPIESGFMNNCHGSKSTMKLTVLGCGGGIGSGSGTTALLLDGDVLIDAGSGILGLSRERLAMIDHVFLTHAHLDHVLGLPLLLDAVMDIRSRPVTVYGLEFTLNCLQQHIFNWSLWPDFRAIPDREKPLLRYAPPLRPGERHDLGNNRHIVTMPAYHSVPAIGFQIEAPSGKSLVFSGDTGPCDAFWHDVNQIDQLDGVIMETAFADEGIKTAEVARHYTPAMLARDLVSLRDGSQIYITHLKPGNEQEIMQQLHKHLPFRQVHQLKSGDVLTF